VNKPVVFTSAGEVELQDKEMPKPAAGEVLIETEVSLVSTGTELTFLSGECPENSKWFGYIHYPMTSGYSNVGIVKETGEGVSKEWIGKRVASYTRRSDFLCNCRSGIKWYQADKDRDRKSCSCVRSRGYRTAFGKILIGWRLYRNYSGKQN